MLLRGAAACIAAPAARAAFAVGGPLPASWEDAAPSAGPRPPADLSTAWLDTDASGHERACVGHLRGPALVLPQRAHQVLPDPRAPGTAWVVSRRPGEWLTRVDLRRGRVLAQRALDDDRRFEGHLAWWPGPDGPCLVSTETDQDDLQGLLVLRDPDDLRVLRTWPSHGIGPHELLTLPQGLLVANGAQLTLAETGRLERAELLGGPPRSDVTLVDPRTGARLGAWPAPHPQAQLRHLARAADGTVAAAVQWRDGASAASAVPLYLLDPSGGDWRAAELPPDLPAAARGYAGSVVAWAGGFVVSAPQADAVLAWSRQGRWVGRWTLPGAWGLAVRGAECWVSGRDGALGRLRHSGARAPLGWHRARGAARRRWDNHLA